MAAFATQGDIEEENDVIASLYEIMAIPGNDKCADCDGAAPTWASVNNGVFICTSCAGVHRSLGVCVSFVKSIKLDKWTKENVEAMRRNVSTAFVNETFLEHSVPPEIKKPHPDSCREDRTIYIRAKYADRLFLPGAGKVPRPPSSIIATDANSSATGIGEIEFVGIFIINLLSAKNLVNTDVVGLCDPYVVMALGSQRIKSRRVLNNQNPIFNEKIMLAWNGQDDLLITVFDEAAFNEDDNIGQCTVNLRSLSLPHGVPLHLDVPLGGVPHGSVQIELLLQELDH